MENKELKLEFLKIVQKNYSHIRKINNKYRLCMSVLIGCLIGLPLTVYGINHKSQPTYIETSINEDLEIDTFKKTANEFNDLEYNSVEINITELDDIKSEMYYDSLEYLARCVEAEAGDQSELGKRLVVDVILNRVDSSEFPNTIEDVINQPYQFSVVLNNSINEVTPAENTYQLIAQELESRENTEVLYFRMDYYHQDTTPVLQEQDHYFSK